MVCIPNLRVIVKACLIVMLTFQQVMVGALPALMASRCGTETLLGNPLSAKPKCSGCGHCPVEKTEQLCGCCASQPKRSQAVASRNAESQPAEAEPASMAKLSVAHSCCGGRQQAESPSIASPTGEAENLSGELSQPRPSSQRCTGFPLVSKHDAVVNNVDSCESNLPEPMPTAENRCRCVGDSPKQSIPHRGESRLQEELTSLRAIAQFNTPSASPAIQGNRAKADFAFHSQLHFAQRHLCIWRI